MINIYESNLLTFVNFLIDIWKYLRHNNNFPHYINSVFELKISSLFDLNCVNFT